jgi:hypothetical protein
MDIARYRTEDSRHLWDAAWIEATKTTRCAGNATTRLRQTHPNSLWRIIVKKRIH